MRSSYAIIILDQIKNIPTSHLNKILKATNKISDNKLFILTKNYHTAYN